MTELNNPEAYFDPTSLADDPSWTVISSSPTEVVAVNIPEAVMAVVYAPEAQAELEKTLRRAESNHSGFPMLPIERYQNVILSPWGAPMGDGLVMANGDIHVDPFFSRRGN